MYLQTYLKLFVFFLNNFAGDPSLKLKKTMRFQLVKY